MMTVFEVEVLVVAVIRIGTIYTTLSSVKHNWSEVQIISFNLLPIK